MGTFKFKCVGPASRGTQVSHQSPERKNLVIRTSQFREQKTGVSRSSIRKPYNRNLRSSTQHSHRRGRGRPFPRFWWEGAQPRA